MPEPVLQAVSYFGIKGKVENGQFHARCPFHEETAASFSIKLKDGLWGCFGCGLGGNFYGFLRKMMDDEAMDALRLLRKLRKLPVPQMGQEDDDIVMIDKLESVDPAMAWSKFHKVNWEKISSKHPVAAYLLGERKFFRSTLDTFDVRFTEWDIYPMVIPWFRGSTLIGYVYRWLEEREGYKKYKFNRGFSAETAIAYYKVGDAPLLICEGIMDVMKAAQFGHPHAAAIPSWRLSEAHAMWLKAQGIKEFICGLDNTTSGRKGFERMRVMLPNVYRFKFPGAYRKDIGELNWNEFNWGMS